MDRNKQREIASKGGKAAHQKGTAHEWTSEEAREAGRKGGMASHRRKQQQQGGGNESSGGAGNESGGGPSAARSDNKRRGGRPRAVSGRAPVAGPAGGRG